MSRSGFFRGAVLPQSCLGFLSFSASLPRGWWDSSIGHVRLPKDYASRQNKTAPGKRQGPSKFRCSNRRLSAAARKQPE